MCRQLRLPIWTTDRGPSHRRRSEGHGRIAGRCIGIAAWLRADSVSPSCLWLSRLRENHERQSQCSIFIVLQLDWGGRQLTLETGRLARQADGAVFATYGDTTVLATVVAAKTPKEGIDFLPLTCNYQEKYYAAGRIPGGYFKREARPDRKGNADFAADRPADPSAVCRRLALRHAGHRHRAVARSGERSRHRRDGRGFRRADAVGRAVHGTDRRRPRRLHQQRVRAQSDRSTRWRRASSISSSPARRTPC